MDLNPLRLKTNCIASDEVLYEHMRSAMQRCLPLHAEAEPHDKTAVLVGSGPSVKDQLESIRKHTGTIIAVKDAHDWLIENGIVPHYAVAVDPQEHRWNCFRHKHPDVTYMIASQCHPAMFDHLHDQSVILWHLYIRKGQTYPPDSLLVTGGTTTGLRAITLFYSMGFRKFDLYGYDSCLQDGDLRVDGTKAGKNVQVVCAGKTFTTTPEMASQANEFQELFGVMPDMEVKSYGEGLITAILAEREKYFDNKSVSFIHYGNDSMASYRYRCRIPSEQLQAPTNNVSADVVIFTKPTTGDDHWALMARNEGRKVVVDFCDDHFDGNLYNRMLDYADAVTCPTRAMAARIPEYYAGPVTVIPDPYEYPLVEPHCNGVKLLWFGHAVNYHSLERVLPEIEDYPLRVVSNRPDCIQWSADIMPAEFARADIVIIPATASYKSPNRTIEAIRQGCFVVAEPHPSLNEFPGIWVGNIKEGIEWARQNPKLANERTLEAQRYVERFSPERTGNAWKTLLKELASTSAVEESIGTITPTLTSVMPPTFDPTCGDFPSRADMRM
jgi:uncharacterized Rossmann fold enzyme